MTQAGDGSNAGGTGLMVVAGLFEKGPGAFHETLSRPIILSGGTLAAADIGNLVSINVNGVAHNVYSPFLFYNDAPTLGTGGTIGTLPGSGTSVLSVPGSGYILLRNVGGATGAPSPTSRTLSRAQVRP